MTNRPPNILITRPAHQAQTLSLAIEKAGGHPILFPTIEITAPSDIDKLQQQVPLISQTDIVIFTSTNAVDRVIPLLQANPSIISKSLLWIAIGQATKEALQKHGEKLFERNSVECPTQYNSEGVLALPCLQQVKNKTIIIFKGLGGRDLLVKTLQQRGAIVHEAIAYQRTLPMIDIVDYLPNWQANGIDGIISTSQESLQNLVTLIGEHAADWLYNLPLIVISKRMASFAQELGFKQPSIVAKNASDAALVTAFIDWRNKHV